MVIGVLLTKSLVGVQPGKTLRELYIRHQAKIVIPLYSGPDKPLFEAIAEFEGKKTHFCVVYESEEHAKKLE